jgi:hypothetical protein
MGSIAPQPQDQVVAQKETKPTFPSEANTLEYAQEQDRRDPLRNFRDQFIIPSKANLKATKVEKPGMYIPSISESTPPHSQSYNLNIRFSQQWYCL